MERNPLVSVVIPAYNAATTIATALETALAQDYEPLEIVVVDDASTDRTGPVVAPYVQRGVRWLALNENQGAAAARNAGLYAARGKYIAFLDADDRWRPRKLSRQVPLMENNPWLSLVTCDSMFVKASGEIVGRSHERHPPAEGVGAWRVLLAHNFIPTPTVLARRDELLALGGFNPRLPVGEDLDLWIRLALRGEVAVVPEVLVEIHDLPVSLMKRYQAREWEIVWPMIQKHIEEQRALLSERDLRAIQGRRLFSAAANFFEQRQYLRSAALFGRSALAGFRPVESLINIPRALLLSAAGGRL